MSPSTSRSANAGLHLLAEVYLGRDLTAMVTKNAHHHDGVCGVRRADDGDMRRLLLRSAHGFDAVDLEEANQPDRVGEAGGQSARAGRGPSYSSAIATRAHGRPVRDE